MASDDVGAIRELSDVKGCEQMKKFNTAPAYQEIRPHAHECAWVCVRATGVCECAKQSGCNMSARVYSVVLGCAQAQELRAVLSGPGISIVPNKVSLSLSLSLPPSLSPG